MTDNPLYGIAAICALLAIAPAFILERRRVRMAVDKTLPYRWALYQGITAVLFGTVLLVAGFAGGSDGVFGGLLFFALYAVTGWFVIRRRRWAWVVLTLASFNPILWIAHYIYGSNRWGEWAREASARRSAKGVSSATGWHHRVLRRVRSWHGGKLVMLWAASVLVFAAIKVVFDPYGHDTASVVLIWLFLCAPLFMATWVWFDSRESPDASPSTPPNEELKPTAPPSSLVE